ncbi:tetratricopeptide repeat protein 31 [Pempheris klunzingeri]|uniref:tetratricopeptide repeat protein 31 n=1 Tax=Pempheris klunzingeri TaxID=3127111 RepID=UPI00397EAFD2
METEFTRIQMMQRVVDMFDRRPRIQRVVRLGLLAQMAYRDELDLTSEDDYEYDDACYHSHGHPGLSDWVSGRVLSGGHARPSSSVYQPPLQYHNSACDLPQKSDTERKERLLQKVKKSKGKAEKKRLKKQRERREKKEKKRLEKLEKEKRISVKNEEVNDDAQQSKAEDSEAVNDKSTNSTNSGVKQLASTEDTDSSDSSEDESSDEDSDTKNNSGDSEELDMTSTFVSKAALIARRKLEQKPKPEWKEKKKIPVKEEPKTVPDKHDQEDVKKDSAAPSTPTIEDNVKISTDLANIGNRFASAGDFIMAVKYFTDAIKYNPTEFKLFGNRSFCFEKMQEYEKALTDAELSLGMCPGWVKGLFRKGRALAGLKRYEEAAEAFREVRKLDSSCEEELMRVQMAQLMEYGFSREQSSHALIIHGTVKKALEVLSKSNHRPGPIQNGAAPSIQVNVSGVSPVLSANTNPASSPCPPQSSPFQNMSNVQSQPKTNNKDGLPPQELFPVWVGNLDHPVTESVMTNLFNKVGVVYSVKVLTSKRCAFVNFTKQEYCDEAIQHFHGFELNGTKIVVRYPDRIPHGMGISKSALKAQDLQDENMRQNEYSNGRNGVGSRRPVRPYGHVPDNRGNYKN